MIIIKCWEQSHNTFLDIAKNPEIESLITESVVSVVLDDIRLIESQTLEDDDISFNINDNREGISLLPFVLEDIGDTIDIEDNQGDLEE
jgi:hypothetical protein